MNIMVRVPCLKLNSYKWGKEEKQKMYEICIREIKKINGLQGIEQDIMYSKVTTPKDFMKDYNCYRGSCFGIAPNFSESLFLRPQIQDKYIKNLYYVGSSIHPGNGISIVMGCGKLAAEQIQLNDIKNYKC